VRLQRLDSGDRLAEVVLVPPAADDDDSDLEDPGAEAITAASDAGDA
jgi:DNA gyrase subunit A